VFTGEQSKHYSRPYLFSQKELVDGKKGTKGRREEIGGLVYSVVTHVLTLLHDFNKIVKDLEYQK
jgi:hypothetical protein